MGIMPISDITIVKQDEDYRKTLKSYSFVCLSLITFCPKDQIVKEETIKEDHEDRSNQ